MVNWLPQPSHNAGNRIMVCDIVVPKSLEIQWQTNQKDDVPMVSLSAMLRSFHQFLIVLLFSLCCKIDSRRLRFWISMSCFILRCNFKRCSV